MSGLACCFQGKAEELVVSCIEQGLSVSARDLISPSLSLCGLPLGAPPHLPQTLLFVTSNPTAYMVPCSPSTELHLIKPPLPKEIRCSVQLPGTPEDQVSHSRCPLQFCVHLATSRKTGRVSCNCKSSLWT